MWLSVKTLCRKSKEVFVCCDRGHDRSAFNAYVLARYGNAKGGAHPVNIHSVNFKEPDSLRMVDPYYGMGSLRQIFAQARMEFSNREVEIIKKVASSPYRLTEEGCYTVDKAVRVR